MSISPKDIIFELSKATGPSGAEESVSGIIAGMLCPYGNVFTTSMGNIVCASGKLGAPYKILLDAHMDEIGLIVTSVEDGFVRAAQVGGADRRVLLAQEVTIWGKEPVTGVFCTVPPHLSKIGDTDRYPALDDMMIDTGLGKKAEDIISIGDRITLKTKPASLMGNRITGKALDDRAGVVSLILALDILKDSGHLDDMGIEILTMISVQEETGEKGAKTGAYALDFNEAIAVDVSFADYPTVPETKSGKIGKGAMIGISPCIDRKIWKKLIHIAKKEDIPYQLEVMGDQTGTNMDEISVSKLGAPCGLISIPLRNMHTPAEVIDIDDVVSTAKLIAEYLRSGGLLNE